MRSLVFFSVLLHVTFSALVVDLKDNTEDCEDFLGKACPRKELLIGFNLCGQDFYARGCKKTCGYCKKNFDECKDDEDCSDIAGSYGKCDTLRVQNCRKTCGRCNDYCTEYQAFCPYLTADDCKDPMIRAQCKKSCNVGKCDRCEETIADCKKLTEEQCKDSRYWAYCPKSCKLANCSW